MGDSNILFTDKKYTPHNEYWCEKISILDNPFKLMADGNSSTHENKMPTSGVMADMKFSLEESHLKIISKITQNRSIEVFIALLAGWNILFSKYGYDIGIVIDSPLFASDQYGKKHGERHDKIYESRVPLIEKIDPDDTIKDSIIKTNNTVSQSYKYQNFPLNISLKKQNLEREILKTNVCIFYNEIHNDCIHPETCDFIIDIQGPKSDGAISFKISYNANMFDEIFILNLAEHYKNVIAGFKDIETPVRNIDILSTQERKKVLVEFNDTRTDYPRDATIVELFEKQVEKTPDAPALIFQDQQLTYAQLNARANQVANFLTKKGADKKSIIAIMEDRNPWMIIDIFGILKTGGAYLPLDIESPVERINTMLNDSNASILLCREENSENIDFAGVIFSPDQIAKEIDQKIFLNPEQANKASDPAYVMYTSGSTGKPKGVIAQHRGVTRLVTNTNYTDIKQSDRILQLSNYAFDGSTYDIFGALLNGASLYIFPTELLYSVSGLCRFIAENKINITFITTALFNKLIDTEPEVITNFDKIYFGGQDASLKHVRKGLQYSKNEDSIVHVYGPTENTTFSTYYVINEIKESDRSIPIGAPISNSQAYILDNDLNPLPVGIQGELYMSGDGISKGYLNKEAMTSEKFLDHPFNSGEKLYKTGDIAKWLPDGNIDFLGRKDNQVKIRGFRIEMGEIENNLLKHPFIRQCFVMARMNQDGNKSLIAYIVGSKDLSVSELREHMLSSLPDYMVPAHFVQLSSLPLNSTTGKVDKNLLPDPDSHGLSQGTTYEAPSNEIEGKLTWIWQELLGKQRIGIHDNFFSLGGDSIKAIQVASRLGQDGLKLDIRTLYLHPTISEAADKVIKTDRAIEQGEITGNVPMTPVQSWFFDTFKPMHRNHFNQSVMLLSEERLDGKALKKVFKKIQEHHDILRVRYDMDGDGDRDKIIQSILSTDCPQSFEIIDLTASTEPSSELESFVNKTQAGIDIGIGPLMKVVLFRLNDGDRVLIVIHHLAIDGVSWRILSEDISDGYRQAVSGEKISLPSKTDSYKRWAEYLQEYSNSEILLKEKEYWKTLESVSVTPLPFDDETNAKICFKDTEISSVIFDEEDTYALLTKVNDAYNTEINDILLTALARTMKIWHGGDRTLIALEGHGREQLPGIDITRTVGWFTSIFPVILALPDSDDTGYQIKHIKESLRKVPNKGMGYGILKYLTPEIQKENISFDIAPRISFNYLGEFYENDGQPDSQSDGQACNQVFRMAEESSGNEISPEAPIIHDFEITGIIIRKQLQISVRCDRKNLKQAEKIAKHFKQELSVIVNHCSGRQDAEITPSDIDYDGLDIDELDAVLNNLDN